MSERIFFALQRGLRGPEPVLFHDEPPQSKAHKEAIIKGSLREVPPELHGLSAVELHNTKFGAAK